MIIHISRQRYEFIRSLGYNFTVTEASTAPRYVEGSNLYHLLAREKGWCVDCDMRVESVDANSAAELETIKACMEMERDPTESIKLMRQDMIAHYKQLLEKGYHIHE